MTIKTYKPASPTVEAFHWCDAPARCLVGSVGTAKTTSALWEMAWNLPRRAWWNWGITHTRWFVIRRNYTWLMDTDVEAALDWMLHGEWHGVAKEMTIVWPPTPSCPEQLTVELAFRAAETPDDEARFRSTQGTGAWIDESIQLNATVKNTIITRLGRFPNINDTPVHFVPRYLVETTNPCPVDHPMYWMYRWVGPEILVEPKLDDDGNPMWQTGRYNTRKLVARMPPGPQPGRPPVKRFIGFWQVRNENTQNLPPSYHRNIADMFPESPEMKAMLTNAKPGYRPEGKGVYRNYDQDRHLSTTPLKWATFRDPYGDEHGVPLMMGWDNTGLQPAAVLVQRVDTMQFQVLREWWDLRAGIIDFTRLVIEDLAERYPGAEISHYCDPAGFAQVSKVGGGMTSNAQMQMEMFKIRLVPASQDLSKRISAVDQLLARHKGLLIDPSCYMVSNGFFGGYVFEENPRMGPTGEFKELPKKNKFSHIHDALQYALVNTVYPLIVEPHPEGNELSKIGAATVRFSDGSSFVRGDRAGRQPQTDYASFDPRYD